jgi:hypothetical protein
MTDLIQIKDVYGDKHYVRAADLSSSKTLLPMFKKDGARYHTRQGFPVLRWTPTCIHRENA